ncbi:dynamin family protein [Pelosinus propionicus]|uniref:Small GTP-binding protein domain-containing protein n=1 Tax=Pelosinus propionicus DSM 13327 TaxID=1123291 RepID=A0A1I4ME22_9FIRM|nr:dynamin family protein [Pelosinus propionicus]SFM01197.1 small GTP-binding protein domain-containing protein [Pelosinus propionicus DSM 13327]
MNHTANHQVTIRSLKGKLLAAYEYLLGHNDQENAEKVKQLAGKLVNEEFTIAFCGHFSAGKSTIINRLVGENLLPSSPIPTSANLVKVKAGEEYVKVFFKNEKPRLYLAPYDYKMVKNYCKDGDQIQSIEISHSDSNLPSQTVIMDTPGIDSADDAHRIATESAIHLADLIFYVMDYNHVQSELNFMFTKELTEAGKEVYLVINQVDKHSDQELSFSEFKTSVVESFSSWGVKPADIFYTSLKQDDHEYNQFLDLQTFLAERLKEKDSLLLQSIFHSLQKITKDHLDAAKKKNELELEPFKDILNELSSTEQAELADNYNRLSEEKNVLGEGPEKAESEFDSEVNKIMANAYLMPFETRALAQSYLESCQNEFKVGWLFTKQKTLAERQERLNLFYQGILEKTKSQVEWHLRDFLLRFLEKKRIDNKELFAKIQSFTVHFSTELLAAAVKAGARLSDTYVINYTDNVATEIKLLAKSILAELKIEMLNALQDKNTALHEKITQKSAGLERYIIALEQIKKYESTESLEQRFLERLLSEANGTEADHFHLFDLQDEEFEVVHGETGQAPQVQQKMSIPMKKPIPKEKAPLSVNASDRMKQTAEKLKKTAELLQGLPGFKKLSGELKEKAERLDHKGFTVALFGAFSAGKSSFANALIGERVLPVSPNPMTAAINKIKPIDESYSHGTVIIKLKEERVMLEEVNHALKLFDFHAESLADARTKVDKINGDLGQQGAAEKTNYTFLMAFTRGYAAVSEQLGTVLEKTITEFSDYVAIEEKSCFVEWIDLYYDCPLTRKGITLVDTPGADSINARHTGVAFDFIKNSDAILFVTYYNHAFSKADREFLIQLGRVKDSFQLDKMFFIINAIDLADNEEEKETVALYVHEQLIKYGVRDPHLYPLSSLQALKEKEERTALPVSGMPSFEEAFYHFITSDLANLATQASENELGRVNRLVAKLIDSTREDAAVKKQKRANIEAEKVGIHAILGQQTVGNLENRLYQETEELIYYIKQRVFLRFTDFFKEAFNPTVLRDDGRNLKKVLQNALDELLEQIGFDFAQEMRATTVRLDRFAEKIIAEYQRMLIERICETNQDLSFSLFEFENKAQIDFEVAFKDIQHGLFSKAMAYFKNPKSFFEKNESKLMSDEMYRVLSSAADEYLQNEQKRILVLYGNVMEEKFGELILQMAEQADDFYLSLLSALDGGVPAEQLMEIQQSLKELI